MRAAAVVTALGVLLAACARADAGADAGAGIDSLNAKLARSYHDRDPAAYGALWTDSAVFEWPAIASPRGPAALSAMAREIWAGERDVELRVTPSSRHVAADRATEFGAFAQAWTDSGGKRMTEYGRYASYLVRGPDGGWRFDRWLGFEDSTRATPRRQAGPSHLRSPMLRLRQDALRPGEPAPADPR